MTPEVHFKELVLTTGQYHAIEYVTLNPTTEFYDSVVEVAEGDKQVNIFCVDTVFNEHYTIVFRVWLGCEEEQVSDLVWHEFEVMRDNISVTKQAGHGSILGEHVIATKEAIFKLDISVHSTGTERFYRQTRKSDSGDRIMTAEYESIKDVAEAWANHPDSVFELVTQRVAPVPSDFKAQLLNILKDNVKTTGRSSCRN